MNPNHAPYRQPICPRCKCGERVCGPERVCGQPRSPRQPALLSMQDPSSRSSAVTGAVANCLVAIPFIGGIFAIIFGLIAVRRARRGRLAVASGLRGKGAYIAGTIMGWSAFGVGILMVNYYLVLLVAIAANS
jgi:hypothetical protein